MNVIKKALVLPGQGTALFEFLGQYLIKDPVLTKHFSMLDDVLNERFADKMLDPQRQLDFLKTSNAQPATVFANFLIAEYFYRLKGLKIADNQDFICGHSLGEFTGLYFNGALDIETCLRLTRQRGLFMEQAIKEYREDHQLHKEDKFVMTAFIMSPTKFELFLSLVRGAKGVYISNINSPKQVVMTGLESRIQELVKEIRPKLGVGAKKLPLTIPFHSPILEKAQEKLSDYISKNISPKALKVPTITNDGLEKVTCPNDALRKLVASTTRPVNFVGMVQKLDEEGVNCYETIAPGSIDLFIKVILKDKSLLTKKIVRHE